jgi:hypothetical protein
MNSLFCRHNRFTAECPICSKNSVLARPAAPERAKPVKPSQRSGKRSAPKASPATVTRYPHVSTEPVEHEARIYEVRLEQVPGGLRLGQWRSGELERKAPVVSASALRELLGEARGRDLVRFDLGEPTEPGNPADAAVSPGRAGDMNEELRLERVGEPGFVRIARWIFWPGTGVGWELQDAPVMLPEKRYEQVLSDAVAKGLV